MSNPVTKNYAHYEDLKEGQKIDLGATRMTKQMIFEYAREFDPFPFHLDEDAANASLLGGLSASGWHTGAVCLRQLLQNLQIRKPVRIFLNPGRGYFIWNPAFDF